jgi:trk system potassium uptake protein TrkH
VNFGRKTDTVYLLSYFILIIFLGTVLLGLPAAWAGTSQYPGRLPITDALFTATSAVCVTGLVTVDTADFTRFGHVVIMLLIQLGGLGIISFTSMLLIVPGRRLPFRRLKTIRSYSVDGVEHDPVRIVRNIVFFTVAIELVGALALYRFFEAAGVRDSPFSALFHAISAFCNAGFSLFPDSLERYQGEPALLAIIAALIVTGGIGFIVLQDIAGLIRGRKKRLSYHTKVILIATLILILGGATAFFLLERDHAFAGMSLADKLSNALFQSITPRTAGFNALPQTELRQPAKLLTIVLMFIGGAPGSIAGGIKIATAYIVLLVMLKRANERGEINSFGRRISASTINAAVVYFIKAVFLLILAAGVLSLFEASRGADLGHIVFEVASAFGTVGLSLDFTKGLSVPGKLVIVATMFSGRVGLIAFVFFGSSNTESFVYPEADILIG